MPLTDRDAVPPILANKQYAVPSAFTPESLLREARRQRGIGAVPVPEVCLLDPDGDIVRRMKLDGRPRRHPGWACYHTDLYTLDLDGLTVGVVGCAVGSAFAVLVAEELFASACRLLISITSSGRLTPIQPPPYFILIERALRDKCTGYHYMPPSSISDAPSGTVEALAGAFDDLPEPVLRGATWTTDAPFRETPQAIKAMVRCGLLAVEMEAAALCAFVVARNKTVVCFAHVTNQTGQVEGDFEKGEADGTTAALAIVARTARRLRGTRAGT